MFVRVNGIDITDIYASVQYRNDVGSTSNCGNIRQIISDNSAVFITDEICNIPSQDRISYIKPYIQLSKSMTLSSTAYVVLEAMYGMTGSMQNRSFSLNNI